MNADRSRQPQRTYCTVSRLTLRIKDALERRFPDVAVTGEISDLSRPSSGHIYFTLKDDRAQIRAVAWRSTAQRLDFDPRDGLEVACQGEIDVYPPRGSYQLVVRSMSPVGVGQLQLRLRALQRKLAAEGLFDPQRKRPLPALARRVAVVTSPTGAAVRDFLEVAARRWPGMRFLIVPVRVQGDGAAREICRAIAQLQRARPQPDVIVVTRGGGSLEDLWSFNEEPLVRAVVASRIPIVSAVGHEVDVTLCDLAADLRALTPSEAAERVTPSRDDFQQRVTQLSQRLAAALRGRAAAARARLESLQQRRVMQHPLETIWQRARQLEELQQRAARALQNRRRGAAERLATWAGKLESLSPLGTLARGYAVALDQQQQLIADAAALRDSQAITLRFRDGRAAARVEGEPFLYRDSEDGQETT